jgi:hypothetical protein
MVIALDAREPARRYLVLIRATGLGYFYGSHRNIPETEAETLPHNPKLFPKVLHRLPPPLRLGDMRDKLYLSAISRRSNGRSSVEAIMSAWCRSVKR